MTSLLELPNDEFFREEKQYLDVVATEEVQLTINVRGDFKFVFAGYPRPRGLEDQIWSKLSLECDSPEGHFSDEGRAMLIQLLTLHDAISIKATPNKISVTFAFYDLSSRDRNFYRGSVVRNIRFYLPVLGTKKDS